MKKLVVGLAGVWRLRTGAADRNAVLESSGSRCARRRGLCRTLRVNDMTDSNSLMSLCVLCDEGVDKSKQRK